MKARFLIPLLLSVPSAALAGQCEDNFTKRGNPLSGTEYFTSVQVNGLAPAAAIGQVRNNGIGRSMNVLDEDLNAGTLVLEEPSSAMHRPLPMQVTATPEGLVTMTLKLRKGAFGKAEEIKKGMCEMIGSLKPGKTAPPRSAAPKPQPVSITAERLASEIKQQADENAAVVHERYRGRAYTVKGVNAGVSDGRGGYYYVLFESRPSLLPGLIQSDSDIFDVRVRCLVQPSQKAYVLTLRNNDRIQMTGVFDEYDNNERLITLKDCVGVK